jgi:hypothetical protein
VGDGEHGRIETRPIPGRLNAAQIAAGMNAAEDNAARLLADAVLLLNAGRYPTAASVAILCIEEAAQVSILRRIATCKDDTERQSICNGIDYITARTATRTFRACLLRRRTI